MKTGSDIYELAEKTWPQGKSFRLVEDVEWAVFAFDHAGQIVGKCADESLNALYEKLQTELKDLDGLRQLDDQVVVAAATDARVERTGIAGEEPKQK